MAESSRYLKLLELREADKSTADRYVCLQMRLRKPQLKQHGPSQTNMLALQQLVLRRAQAQGDRRWRVRDQSSYLLRQT